MCVCVTVCVCVHVNKRSKQGHTNNKAKQHNTPKAQGSYISKGKMSCLGWYSKPQHIHVQSCIYMYIVCSCPCMYAVCVCVYVCVCVCVCVCVRACVYGRNEEGIHTLCSREGNSNKNIYNVHSYNVCVHVNGNRVQEHIQCIHVHVTSSCNKFITPLNAGKTLLAKAVANQTSATFLRVCGSELIQKYLVSSQPLSHILLCCTVLYILCLLHQPLSAKRIIT